MEVLARTFKRIEEAKDISDGDIEYYRRALGKENHCYKKQHKATVDNYIQSKDIAHRPNASMNITRADCAPFLPGKAQLRTIYNNQRELLLKELALRGIFVDRKEKIRNAKLLLI